MRGDGILETAIPSDSRRITKRGREEVDTPRRRGETKGKRTSLENPCALYIKIRQFSRKITILPRPRSTPFQPSRDDVILSDPFNPVLVRAFHLSRHLMDHPGPLIKVAWFCICFMRSYKNKNKIKIFCGHSCSPGLRVAWGGRDHL